MKNKSFTLIELLVVIVIIGILAGVIIVSTSSSIGKANIAKVKVFENSIQNELGANMVSRWKLDEIVGTTTTPDAWGSNTGTLGDGVTDSTYPTVKSESECVTGKCMSFDGGDYIQIPYSIDLAPDLITYSCWAFNNNWSLASNFRLISKTESGGYNFESGVDGYIAAAMNIGGTYLWAQYSLSYLSSGWHQFLATFDGRYVRLYIDSVKVATLDKGYQSTLYYVNNNSLIIGGEAGVGTGSSGGYFNGYIDDVRIYNGAISSAQIKQNYIAGLNSLLANNNISNEEYLSRIENLSLND